MNDRVSRRRFCGALLFLPVLSASLGACTKAHGEIPALSTAQVAQKLEEAKAGKLSLFIYDNNSEARFKKSRLPGARWVKYDQVKKGDLPDDKEATLVFYCANEH